MWSKHNDAHESNPQSRRYPVIDGEGLGLYVGHPIQYNRTQPEPVSAYMTSLVGKSFYNLHTNILPGFEMCKDEQMGRAPGGRGILRLLFS